MERQNQYFEELYEINPEDQEYEIRSEEEIQLTIDEIKLGEVAR